MAGDNRGDAAHQRVHRADKRQQERKRTEYIHSASASPRGFATGALHAASLGSAGRGWFVATGSGFILGSALGLNMFGNKPAISPWTSLDKGLRLVFERVRQRVAANVRDAEGFPLLFQCEVNAARAGLDAAFDDDPRKADAMSAVRGIQRL